jgi:hypothetical protein
VAYRVPPIPILQSIAIGTFKEYGRTRPLALKCQSEGEAELIEYIVKFYADMDLGTHGLAKELLGSLLASYFGLTTPEPAIIEVSEDLYQQESNLETSQKLRRSLGYNFGSRTIEAGIFTPLNSIRDELVPEAVMIFCFDSLILNPDRRVDKPNMFENRNGFIVFDHEMAFPYSHPETMLGGLPNPWELNTVNAASIRDHFFYREIRKYDIDIEPFVEKLSELSDSIIAEMAERLPILWRSEYVDNIILYLSRARENAERLRTGIQEVLA